ncbi:hypothetical protein ACJJIE_04410 [Microbulbifer sp. TRSA001]|uniref:hypothetical protein n=1 Tax=Microbulbifer sp. TRSA001 TaxID=3243381 RepID=UPI00403A4E56
MESLLKELVFLSCDALKEEDHYLRESLSNNQCYSCDKTGVLSINNERYYQFIIARYLFRHFSRRIQVEYDLIDLVVFREDLPSKVEVAVEMKRWMSSAGSPEIPGIRSDFDKLRKCDSLKTLVLIFSSNPKNVSIKGNIHYLSNKIDRDLDPDLWVYESFDTVGGNGAENVFWVAGYDPFSHSK